MRIATLVGVPLLTLLVACGSEVSGDPMPPSPSPTVTATPSPPTLPSEAMASTSDAAVAFVQHWVAVLNYASQTGDVQFLSVVSSDECVPCQKLINTISKTYSAGGYTKGEGWAVDQFARSSTPHLLHARILVQPQEILDEAGGGVHQLPGEIYDARITLEWKRGRWVLLDLVRV